MNPSDYLMEQLKDKKARLIKSADQLEKEYTREYTKWEAEKHGQGYEREEIEEVGRRAIAIRENNGIRIKIKSEIVEKTGVGYKDIKVNHGSAE